MTRRKWTITTELTGRVRKIDVMLYDTLGQMRAATHRWNKVTGEDGRMDHSLAVCQSFSRIRVYKNGSEKELPNVLIVRFVRGHLSPEIVAHEVTHAASHLYGIDYLPMLGVSEVAKDHFQADNEDFAYIVGNLFSAFWKLLENER